MTYLGYRTNCPDGTEHTFYKDYFVKRNAGGPVLECTEDGVRSVDQGDCYYERDRTCTKCGYSQWVRLTEAEYLKFDDGIPEILRILPKPTKGQAKPKQVEQVEQVEQIAEPEPIPAEPEPEPEPEPELTPPPPTKRTRRSPAEMEAARALEAEHPREKRKRRSPAEMEAARAEVEAATDRWKRQVTAPKPEVPVDPVQVVSPPAVRRRIKR